MLIRSLLVIVCVICSAGLVVSTTGPRALTQVRDRGEPIDAPENWVSFSATVTRHAKTGDVIRGTLHRGADGSELLVETIPGQNGSNVVVRHITNYTQRVYYHSTKAAEWFSGPLAIPDGAQGPPWITTGMTGLERYPKKLALRAGQDGSLTSDEGLSAYIYTNKHGVMRLMVPELNFYPVVSSPVTGARRVLTNIVIGPVPSSPFLPAPGDIVTGTDEPMPNRAH